MNEVYVIANVATLHSEKSLVLGFHGSRATRSACPLSSTSLPLSVRNSAG